MDLSTTESKKPGPFYGYVIVIVGFFAMALIWGTTLTFGVFLKPMVAEFGWTRATASGAFSLSMFLFGLFSVLTGKLNDRFGPRIVITACSLCLGLAFLLMSQINTVLHLYLLYGFVVATGTSGSFVPLASTVARWFVKRRGLMTGIVLSGYGAGGMIGAPVANGLISSCGWRTSYFIMAIIASVLLIFIAQFLKRDPGKGAQLPYEESEVMSKKSDFQVKGFSPKEATHTRQLWMLCLIYVFFGIGQMAITVHIVPYATDMGISTFTAANILAIAGGLNSAGRIGTGSVSDKIGNKPALVISLVLLSVSLLWLLATKKTWMLYLFAIIFGFGNGGVAALMSPVVAELFGMRAHGAILGIVMFAVGIGTAIGPTLAGYVFDVTDGYQSAFTAFAILSILSLALATLLKSTIGADLA